jgi:hypothetical protein
MRIFRPGNAPLWLEHVLTSIERGLREIWPLPFRLWRVPTADLPPASEHEGAWLYDSTSLTPKFSDGTDWLGTLNNDNAALVAIGALTPAADRLPYFTSGSAAALATFTAAGRALVDDADATAQRATLGLGTAAVKNTGTSGTNVPLLDGANTWSGQQTISVAGSTASPQLLITGATNQWISFGAGGYGPPTYTTRSVGTKAVLYEALGASSADYAFGIDFGTLWLAASQSSEAVKIYGGTQLFATFNSTGLDVVGEVRCDTLRIDATPTAAGVAQTHHVPVNINGTVYKLLLAT